MTALALAMWPLGRAHDVSVSALFRDEVAPERRWPRLSYMLATGLVAGTLAALAILLAYDRRIAAIFVAAAAGVFLMLRLVASLVMLIARRIPRPRSTMLRLAIANIHRPGALTSAVVLSLGLGLTLLTTLMLIDGNLRKELTASIPDQAPSFYFLDVQSDRLPAFMDFLRQQAPEAKLNEVALLRGRITAIGGTAADQIVAKPDSKWVLEGDRGLGQPGDGDDVAGLGLLDRLPLEAAEGEELGQPRGLDDGAVAAQRLHRHVEFRGAAVDPPGQHAAEV